MVLLAFILDDMKAPGRRDQVDTCTSGEKSGIKRIQPITRGQGTDPNRFVRVADAISLTQLTYQQLRANVAAGSRHAWWLEFGGIDPLEGAILGLTAKVSLISGVPWLGGFVNLFLCLGIPQAASTGQLSHRHDHKL